MTPAPMSREKVIGALATMALHHGERWEQIHDAVAALYDRHEALVEAVDDAVRNASMSAQTRASLSGALAASTTPTEAKAAETQT